MFLAAIYFSDLSSMRSHLRNINNVSSNHMCKFMFIKYI